jgi:hypothetical protein
MWTRLDDALLDHRKLLEAARLLGKDGRAKALGFYTASLLYSSKHLTDGKLSKAVIEDLHISGQGIRALVTVGLWRRVGKTYVIHDYLEYNTPAADVRERRKKDAARKRKTNGNGAR